MQIFTPLFSDPNENNANFDVSIINWAGDAELYLIVFGQFDL